MKKLVSQNGIKKIVNAAYGEMEQIIDKTSESCAYRLNEQYMIFGYLEDSNGEDDMWIHLSVEREGNICFETDTENDTSKSGLKKAVEECIRWFYDLN